MIRPSKYRHVYGQPNKKETCIDNTRLNSKSAFDSNLAKANTKYLSLNWASSGGGILAVLPLNELGKLGDKIPLFVGHKGTINDSAWDPFNSQRFVTSSDDGRLGVWHVPEDFTTKVPDDAELDDIVNIEPERYIKAHGKKVGHVEFNPAARDIVASSGFDYAVRVFNLSDDSEVAKLPHKDLVTGFSWSGDGSRIATISRDKKIRVWDVRAEKVLSEGSAHQGAKAARIVWLGDEDRIATTGFSKFSERQIGLWKADALEEGPVKGFIKIDQESGVIMPFYDPGTHILWIAGRGDTRIVYFEFANDDLLDLFSFSSTLPQRGLALAPQHGLNIEQHEIAHFYKIHETMVEPITFYIPRKGEEFLDDVYKTYRPAVAALEASEWVGGATKHAVTYKWEDAFYGRENEVVKVEPKAEPKAESKKEEVKESAPAKETPKEEPKKEASPAPKKEASPAPKTTPKEAPQESSPAPLPAHLKAEKQDAYEVFQSKDVQKMLAKNAESDEEEPESESNWDEPSGAPRVATPKAASKETTPAPKETTPAPKDTPVLKEKEVTPTPQSPIKSAQDSVADAKDTVARASAAVERAEASEPSTPSTSASRPLGKLHELASTVNELKALVLSLSERLEKLENK